MSTLTYGELFAGYGGLGMGVQSVLGGEMAWCAEFDKAPSAILAHHWPDVPNLGDVTKVDWHTAPPVDVITGGSPCQDLSHAGKRAGMKAGTRSGLWASMCDAIEIIRPRLVVWENVRGALSASADSAVEPCPICVGDGGRVSLRALGRVLGDLAELRYDAWWVGLRAADVGAAHGRFRVFVFAQPADADVSGLEGLADQAGAAQAGRHGHAESGVVGPALSAAELAADIRFGMAIALASTPERHCGCGCPAASTWAHTAFELPAAPTPLVPTPLNSDAGPRGGTTGFGLRDWSRAMPAPGMETCLDCGRCDGGCDRVAEPRLLPSPRTSDTNGPGTHGTGGPDLRTEVSLLPTPMVGSTSPASHGQISGQYREAMAKALQDWREYEAAIRRQEQAFGRLAPLPTEPGAKGQPRLSPRFVEWLMGLPEGHVTDVPGVSRNDQLKALGNGVVPPQAAAATLWWLAQVRAARQVA